jgi:hypothetical protein
LKKKGAERMSFDKVAGQAIGGEFNAENLLKLFSYEPPRYRIPAKIKYTGSRKALRKLKKERNNR